MSLSYWMYLGLMMLMQTETESWTISTGTCFGYTASHHNTHLKKKVNKNIITVH